MAYTYFSMEDLAVHMVVRRVFPSLNTSTIDVRRESKVSITRWANLHTVAVGQRHREVN